MASTIYHGPHVLAPMPLRLIPDLHGRLQRGGTTPSASSYLPTRTSTDAAAVPRARRGDRACAHRLRELREA